MPLDSTGTFRHNHESAAFHSRAAGKSIDTPKDDAEVKDGNGEDHVEIHSHGDGTFHTMHKGEKVDHESHKDALMHAAQMHGGDFQIEEANEGEPEPESEVSGKGKGLDDLY